MMKKFFLVFLCLCTLSVSANNVQSKMSEQIRKLSQEVSTHGQAATDHRTVSAFVKLRGAEGHQLLANTGCNVVTQIGDIVIADVPVAKLQQLAESDAVVRIETHVTGRLCLDSTAVHTNVAPAYAGEDLPQAFTGQGVLLGISDIGFDLTHPTFYTPDGQTYRIQRFLDQFTANAESFGHQVPLGVEYTTEEAILSKAHSGDAGSEMHGTHCLGIAGGSGYTTNYRGMAWEADLCAVASKTGDGVFYSPNEVAILKYIFDYADSIGQPCVITYSIGFDDVPGDAVLFEEALDELLGPGHILVAAAGNENTAMRYFRKGRNQAVAGGLMQTGWFSSDATFRVFSADHFTLTLTEYDSWSGTAKGTPYVLDSNDLPLGTVKLNNSPFTVEQEDTIYTVKFTLNPWSSSLGDVGIVVEGEDAQVEVLSAYGTSLANATHIDPRLANVVSGHTVIIPGTLPRVVTVGAMCWSKTGYSGGYGKIADFSSQGPTMDGRIKPDVVTPGVNIMSALNSYYSGESAEATSYFNGRTYGWVRASGTSMATPAAAGVVALWLQAKPDLTPEDVLDVIAHTSQHPSSAVRPKFPNNIFGHGEIDAYRGLLYILDTQNAIHDLSQHQPQQARFVLRGRQLSVEAVAVIQQQAELRVYSLQGRLMATTRGTSIDLSSLPAGVYAVQLNTGQAETTGSTLIRL